MCIYVCMYESMSGCEFVYICDYDCESVSAHMTM